MSDTSTVPETRESLQQRAFTDLVCTLRRFVTAYGIKLTLRALQEAL